jgi:long-chain fatty acid transport protein
LFRTAIAGASWLFVSLVAGSALASGFSVARFSGEHGHPTTDNATALYHNPAALRGEQGELLVDGLLGVRRATYTRSARPSDAADLPGSEGANVGRATLFNALLNPSVWLALSPTPRLKLAAGVFTPFGGPIRWDERERFRDSQYPGPLDGVTRFHAIEGLLFTSYGSLGAAYGLGESGLRVGLAANLMYSSIEDVRAWSSGSNSVRGEGRSLLDVSGFAWGLGAGVFYEDPERQWRLGASYQSRPNFAGGMKLGGKLVNDIGGPSSADVELHQNLPDIVRLGMAYRARDNLELRLFAAWERWSAFEQQCVTQAGASCELLSSGAQPEGGKVLQNVPRDFQDAFEARAGLSVWTTPKLELFSGLGVMTEAVPDATLEASLPDFFGVTFSLGARYALSPKLLLASSLSHIVSPARDSVSRYASYELPSKLPDSSGHYTQAVTYADLNVALRF